jgi:hypothetical protein
MVRARHSGRRIDQAEDSIWCFYYQVARGREGIDEARAHVLHRRYYRPLIDVFREGDGDTMFVAVPLGERHTDHETYASTVPEDLETAAAWLATSGGVVEGETVLVTVPLDPERAAYVETPFADTPEVESRLLAYHDALQAAGVEAVYAETIAARRAELAAQCLAHLAALVTVETLRELDVLEPTPRAEDTEPPPRRLSPVATCHPSTAPPRGRRCRIRPAVVARTLAPPG